MYIHICMSCLTVTLSQLIDLRVSQLRRLLDINLEIMQYHISRYSSNIAYSNNRMIPFSGLLVTRSKVSISENALIKSQIYSLVKSQY